MVKECLLEKQAYSLDFVLNVTKEQKSTSRNLFENEILCTEVRKREISFLLFLEREEKWEKY
jgi:hypothetical protein